MIPRVQHPMNRILFSFSPKHQETEANSSVEQTKTDTNEVEPKAYPKFWPKLEQWNDRISSQRIQHKTLLGPVQGHLD